MRQSGDDRPVGVGLGAGIENLAVYQGSVRNFLRDLSCAPAIINKLRNGTEKQISYSRLGRSSAHEGFLLKQPKSSKPFLFFNKILRSEMNIMISVYLLNYRGFLLWSILHVYAHWVVPFCLDEIYCIVPGDELLAKIISEYHGKKGFVILTKSFVKIGITKTFCFNSKIMFSSVNKTFGCCSKIFGCSNTNFICSP